MKQVYDSLLGKNVQHVHAASDLNVTPITDPVYLRLDGGNTPTANIDIGTHKLTNVVDPAANQDAATKKYVDASSLANGGNVNGIINFLTGPIRFISPDGTIWNITIGDGGAWIISGPVFPGQPMGLLLAITYP